MLLIIFLAFSTACLELSFQSYMTRGMIFEFLFVKLKRLETKSPALSKVLGLCPYCNGFWLAVFFYIYTFNEVSVYLFLCTGIQFVFIYIYLNYIKK